MKKNLSYLLILFSLLFNIQTGFTHDIEHQYHGDEHHESAFDCEDCVLQDHSTKTTNFSYDIDFSFIQTNHINDNYLLRDIFSLGLVAYQSRAP